MTIINGGNAFSTFTENQFDIYWDVDGFALQTYAYNIESWGGGASGGGLGRETPPAPRGANITIPGRPGQQYQPKMPDSRIITLSMWVVGANPDGSAPVDGDMRAAFEYNYKSLRNLLMRSRRQFQLTKRFREYGSTEVVTATALAEYSAGLDIQMTGNLRGIFTVDLLLADPYFYEPVVTTPPLSSSPLPFDLTGDDRSFKVTANFEGSLVNPKVTITTPEYSSWAQLTDVINTGEVASMDAYNCRATHGSNVVSIKVSHGGAPQWLFVEPGINYFSVNTLGGTGTATVSYQKAHL